MSAIGGKLPSGRRLACGQAKRPIVACVPKQQSGASMRVSNVLLVSCAMGWAASAGAQTVSVEELARRVEALERDNAALRAQIQQIKSPPVAAPVQHAPLSAQAATAPTSVQHPPEPWDHAYVGISGGYSTFRNTTRPDAIDRELTSHGPTFGAQVGRRWQSGSVVTGLELEANFPLNSNNITVLNIVRGRGPVEQFPVSENELTARMRLKGSIGFSSGSLLGYGIAGLDVSRMLLRINTLRTNIPNDREFTTRVFEQYTPGFVFGVGAAYNLNRAISVELEATRSSLGDLGANSGTFGRSDSVILRLNQALP